MLRLMKVVSQVIGRGRDESGAGAGVWIGIDVCGASRRWRGTLLEQIHALVTAPFCSSVGKPNLVVKCKKLVGT